MKILEKFFKKLTVCLMFLLFTMNVYSAVVSDSVGNAFVTKQEFETYKEKFNKQIDQYNRSIDSKIDGAISSYLAGISYTRVEVLNNCTSLLKYPLNIYMNSKYYFALGTTIVNILNVSKNDYYFVVYEYDLTEQQKSFLIDLIHLKHPAFLQ